MPRPVRSRLVPVLALGSALLLLTSSARAQMPAHSPKTIDYQIDCALLDDHVIQGTVTATWRNQSDAPTSELWWHVYNNAFAARDSVFLTEAHRMQHRGGLLPAEFGGTEIQAVRLLGLGRIDFDTRPPLPWNWVAQAEAADDRTVFKADLPGPVEPGQSVVIQVEFQARMIPAYRRNGWGSDDYLHAAQWYPKLGVFEELDGGMQWNCPPYHLLVEFYADYADFIVRLTLPERIHGNVVASGEQRAEAETLPDGHTRHTFYAEDVHDFAWTVDPQARILEREWNEADYRDVAEEQKVAAALGLPVEEVRPDSAVRMILLLQPEDAEYEERYFTAIGKSLYYYGLWYGAYPYPTITCVDPANDAGRTGGMEYPRLFTAGVRRGGAPLSLSPEGVTVHEFGHQYWYGLVGTDEFRHAWMDEGFCTFSTQRLLRKAYPAAWATYTVLGRQRYGRAPLAWPAATPGDPRAMLSLARLELPSLGQLPARSVELWRSDGLQRFLAEMPPASYWPQVRQDSVYGMRRSYRTDFYQPMDTPSLALFEEDLRGVNTYRRPALTLETMARLMGEERWIRTLRAYHQRYRYGHPRPRDWFAVVREFASGARVGADLPGGGVPIVWQNFWDQAYHGNELIDFGVHRVVNLPHLVRDEAAPGGVREADGLWDIHIELRRFGAFEVPVVVEATFADGTVSRRVWDGRESTWAWRQLGSDQRVAQVVVDPDRVLVLDRNWLNNSRLVDLNQDFAIRAGLRALLWAQSVLHYFGGVG